MATALGPAGARRERAYLALLERTLSALEARAEGRPAPLPRSRAAARRFLAPRVGRWHDGDENLVRGWLDRWSPGEDPDRARAGAACAAARALAGIRCRPETLWFLLWALESVVAGLAAAE